MSGRRLRQLLLTKTFPDGHTEQEVVTLHPKTENEMNPVFESDGEYYYWGEKFSPGQVGVYRPARRPYKQMTAMFMTRKAYSKPGIVASISKTGENMQETALPMESVRTPTEQGLLA